MKALTASLKHTHTHQYAQQDFVMARGRDLGVSDLEHRLVRVRDFFGCEALTILHLSIVQSEREETRAGCEMCGGRGGRGTVLARRSQF